MLDKILIFIIFLGPLVFFHELGHFLFARFFGVRVETFSIGFGPKIFSFKRGDTQYAISIIPLGGYVKMYGDNILERDEVPQEERSYAYTHQSIWARFWIVFGGPLANFIMAFVLFFFLFVAGETSPQARLGGVHGDSFLHKEGFRSADIIQTLNGGLVENLSDFSLIQDGKKNLFTVKRGEEVIPIQSSASRDELLKSFFESMGSPLRQPLMVDKFGQFYALSRNENRVDWTEPLEDLYYEKSLYMIPIKKGAVKDKEKNIFLDRDLLLDKSVKKSLGDIKEGFYPADLMASSLVMGSAADEKGLLAGDILVSVQGEKLSSFSQMALMIGKLGKEKGEVSLSFLREGKMQTKLLKVKEDKDGFYRIGIYRRGDFLIPKMVKSSSKGFFNSIPLAFGRTWRGMKEVVITFKKLILGDASMKNLGGPIAIGKYAAASFYNGITQFFAFMAMMSINLGIINLFPIPVLDGGHIVFLGIEFLNRGPLSKRKTEVAYQIGFSLLMMLLVVALVNDFTNLFS